MSLNSIDEYVNSIVLSCMKKDINEVVSYFTLMSNRANDVLEVIKKTEDIKLMNEFLFNQFKFSETQKEIINESIKYILSNTDDVFYSINVIETSGILSDESIYKDKYDLIYKLEKLLLHASNFHFNNLSPWQSFIQRNKPRDYFYKKFVESFEVDLDLPKE